MMKKNGKVIGDILSALTVAVLFLVILIMVVFSAMSYQRSVEIQDDNNNTRAVLSYVITAVKADEAGLVTVDDDGSLQILRIADGSTGYEQQIYHKDGKVLESYGKTGTIPDPEEAIVIGQADSFEFSWAADDLLEIQTDIGKSYVHIR